MRLFLVLNPRAHAGRAGEREAEIISVAAGLGQDVTVRRTEAPGHAETVVRELEPGEFDVVVAGGGDGTLFEVVNGLMARPAENREALGVLPLGTGNAFARDLGLQPEDWRPALQRIAEGRQRPVDVGEVTGADDRFWFINMIGAGFVVDAARMAQRLKALGRAAYTLGALARLVVMPRYPLEIEIDGVPLAVDSAGPGRARRPDGAFFVEIANSRYTGTHFCMAPGARIDDGLLDVVLVDSLSRRRALHLFPSIYEGGHVRAPEVSVHQAREVRLLGPKGLACAVDGEFRGSTPLQIRCHAGALNVIAEPPRREPVTGRAGCDRS